MEQNKNVVEYDKVQTSKLAIAGLLLGIGSILLAVGMGGFYLGIPGIVVSIIALIHIRRKYLEGNTLAKVGLITSMLGLIGSIFVIVLFASGMNSLRNAAEKEVDVRVAEGIASATKWIYIGPYEEELPSLIGTKIEISENAEVPACVKESISPLWDDRQLHGPIYTDNGAYAFVIQLGETECEAVYITDGICEWEVWPTVDEEYR